VMTDKFEQFNHLTNKRSPSSLVLMAKCPHAWWREYVLGIKSPPTREMQCGILFDDFITYKNTTTFDYLGLSDDDIAIILSRYELYKPHLDPSDWLQKGLCAELAPDKNLYGFSDIIKVDNLIENSEGAFDRVDQYYPTLIIDTKYSQHPWPWSGKPKQEERNGQVVWVGSSTKTQHSKYQAQAYKWLCKQMYGVDLPFQFHVLNHENDMVQIIPYKPTAKSMDAFVPWCLEQIAKIDAGSKECTPGYHCKGATLKTTWKCNHYDTCPAMLEKQGQKDAQDEIVKKYCNVDEYEF